MPRISVLLSRDEEQALIELAFADLRVPNVEARFLLREELIRRGVLKTHLEPNNAESPTATSTNNVPPQSNSPSSEEK